MPLMLKCIHTINLYRTVLQDVKGDWNLSGDRRRWMDLHYSPGSKTLSAYPIGDHKETDRSLTVMSA